MDICSKKSRELLINNMRALEILDEFSKKDQKFFDEVLNETVNVHEKDIISVLKKIYLMIPILKRKVIYKVKDTARLILFIEKKLKNILKFPKNKKKIKNEQIFIFMKELFKMKEITENIKFLKYILKSEERCKRAFKNYKIYFIRNETLSSNSQR